MAETRSIKVQIEGLEDLRDVVKEMRRAADELRRAATEARAAIHAAHKSDRRSA